MKLNTKRLFFHYESLFIPSSMCLHLLVKIIYLLFCMKYICRSLLMTGLIQIITLLHLTSCIKRKLKYKVQFDWKTWQWSQYAYKNVFWIISFIIFHIKLGNISDLFLPWTNIIEHKLNQTELFFVVVVILRKYLINCILAFSSLSL